MCLFDPLCGINLLRGGFLFNLLDRMEFFSSSFFFGKVCFARELKSFGCRYILSCAFSVDFQMQMIICILFFNFVSSFNFLGIIFVILDRRFM